MEDLQPSKKEVVLPDEILKRNMYIYRGFTGKVAEDGYPGKAEDFSFWAPTPDLPFTAMR